MILKKGFSHIAEIKEITIEDFSKILLKIVNTKCSDNSFTRIFDIKTIYGTNKINITSETDLTEWLQSIDEKIIVEKESKNENAEYEKRCVY